MRALLLAGAFALVSVAASAQGAFDFSAATGKSAGAEASSSNVTGTGSNMSGGMVDAFSQATDMSASMGGPHHTVQTGTTGTNESGVSEMTFDVGTGSDTGTATGSGSSSASFAGVSIVAPHHHR